MNRLILCSAFVLIIGSEFYAQQNPKQTATANAPVSQYPGRRNPAIRETTAYAELLVSKTEAEADLQILLVDFNEEAPQVKEKRFELGLLDQAIKTLETTPADKLSRLTPAVGKLIVRRIEAETKLKTLTENYAEEHPFVKKGRIRVQVFSDTVKKLLQ